MSTPISHLLATMAGLATAYSLTAAPGSAWADDAGSVQPVPAEFAQWQSVLTDSGRAPANPEWKSTLSAAAPDGPAESRASHGTLGLRKAPQYGFRFPPDYFDVPKGAR